MNKRRFFRFLIALAAALLLCASAGADTVKHSPHGTALTDTMSTLSGGNYYLAGDVTLNRSLQLVEGTQEVPVVVNLCLNGYVLRLADGVDGSVIYVGKYTTLNLYDCRPNTENGVEFIDPCDGVTKLSAVGGLITGGKTTAAIQGAGITVGRNEGTQNMPVPGAVLNMYGGTIAGNQTSAIVYSAGGVYAHGDNCAFTMEGGSIFANESLKGGSGGVTASAGSVFTLKGGSIHHNRSATNGGGVAVGNSSVITMTGGVIQANKADSSGGGIHMNYGGTVDIRGGRILSNTAAKDGGGVCVRSTSGDYEASFKADGAQINGNVAGGNGGGIYAFQYANPSTVELIDTTVKNNACGASSNGGGIYFNNNAALLVSGQTVITDNTRGMSMPATADNVYLGVFNSAQKIITVKSALTGSARIGVNTQNAPTAGKPVGITAPAGADYSAFFVSDNALYPVVNSGAGGRQVVQLSIDKPDPVITAPAGAQTVSVPQGATATFSVTAKHAVSYQWQRFRNGGTEWEDVGTGGTSYTVSSVTSDMDGDMYRCVVFGETDTMPAVSPVFTVDVALAPLPPVITKPVSPQSQSALAGRTATFSVSAENAVRYLWQQSTDGGATWHDIGQNSPSYTTSAVKTENDGYLYRCTVFGAADTTPAVSPIFILKVTTPPTPPVTGDRAAPALWLALAVLCAAGVWLTVRRTMRRRKA